MSGDSFDCFKARFLSNAKGTKSKGLSEEGEEEEEEGGLLRWVLLKDELYSLSLRSLRCSEGKERRNERGKRNEVREGKRGWG